MTLFYFYLTCCSISFAISSALSSWNLDISCASNALSDFHFLNLFAVFLLPFCVTMRKGPPIADSSRRLIYFLVSSLITFIASSARQCRAYLNYLIMITDLVTSITVFETPIWHLILIPAAFAFARPPGWCVRACATSPSSRCYPCFRFRAMQRNRREYEHWIRCIWKAFITTVTKFQILDHRSSTCQI